MKRNDLTHILVVRTFEDVINQVSEDKVSMIENHLKGIVRGLAEIHRQGVVHRDVKPGNILLDDNNCIRIIDFGHCMYFFIQVFFFGDVL